MKILLCSYYMEPYHPYDMDVIMKNGLYHDPIQVFVICFFVIVLFYCLNYMYHHPIKMRKSNISQNSNLSFCPNDDIDIGTAGPKESKKLILGHAPPPMDKLTTQILKKIWKLEKDEDVTLRNLIDLRKTVGGYQRLSDWSSISVARKRNLWSGSVVNTGSTVASFELTL